MLQRSLRDHGETIRADRRAAIDTAVVRLGAILRRVSLSNDRAAALRGAEGEAAQLYFGVFGDLIRASKSEIAFRGRSRRPPLDPVSAVLSFLYTLLTHDCRSAAESGGLDPAVGFLRRDRPGRPSLALDLMEELRSIFADRLALSLFNRRQIGANDFSTRENRAVLLSEAGRKTVLTAWQERKKVERRHPFLDETAPLGLVPYVQAQLLARHLRGDLDAYPPWFWKWGIAAPALVTYDVNVTETGGARRLRRVAKACRDFGQRVQYSVFEIEVDPAQWTMLKARLESIINREHDSLRYYYLGANWQRRIEHVGAKPAVDLGGPLIV